MSDAAEPSLLKRLMQILRGEDASSAAIRESLEEVIEDSERQSPALSQQERVMMANLLAFGELKVRDVMVPRAEIVAVDEVEVAGDPGDDERDGGRERLRVARGEGVRGVRDDGRDRRGLQQPLAQPHRVALEHLAAGRALGGVGLRRRPHRQSDL